jgi:hypothetical protein
MLKLQFIQIFLLGFPETFLCFWAINYINNNKIQLKVLFITSFIIDVIIYFVRLLPILYGSNTIITILLFIFSAYKISNISLVRSISSCLIVSISMSVCELINIFIITFLNLKIQNIISNKINETIYLLPSFIFFIMFIIIYNYINEKYLLKGRISNVFDRESF